MLELLWDESQFRFLGLAVAVRGEMRRVCCFPPSPRWVWNQQRARRMRRFPPALPLIIVGTSIIGAEESLKLKPLSSWASMTTVRLALQKAAVCLKGNNEACSTFRRTLVCAKPQRKTLGYLCQRGRNLVAEAGRKLLSSLANPLRWRDLELQCRGHPPSAQT